MGRLRLHRPRNTRPVCTMSPARNAVDYDFMKPVPVLADQVTVETAADDTPSPATQEPNSSVSPQVVLDDAIDIANAIEVPQHLQSSTDNPPPPPPPPPPSCPPSPATGSSTSPSTNDVVTDEHSCPSYPNRSSELVRPVGPSKNTSESAVDTVNAEASTPANNPYSNPSSGASSTGSVAFRRTSAPNLTRVLRRLSHRMPRPMPIYVQRLEIDLGDIGTYDNFDEAVAAVQGLPPSRTEALDARVTVDMNGAHTLAFLNLDKSSDAESTDHEDEKEDDDDDGNQSESGSDSSSSSSSSSSGISVNSDDLDTVLNQLMSMPANTPPPDNANSGNRNPDILCCEICVNDKNRYDDFERVTSECMHSANICKTCLVQWVTNHMNDSINPRIRCPYIMCDIYVPYEDILRITRLETEIDSSRAFTRYDQLVTRRALGEITDFVWCTAEGCESGQIHDMKDGPIMTCVACGFQTCAHHQRPWHQGQTCDQFQRGWSRARNEERRHAFFMVFRRNRSCPGCGMAVEKNGGCDHMRCIGCNYEYCYSCSAPYNGTHGIWSRGRGAHRLGCRHYYARMPWRWFRR